MSHTDSRKMALDERPDTEKGFISASRNAVTVGIVEILIP